MSDFSDAAIDAEAGRQRRADEERERAERQQGEQNLRALLAVGIDFAAAAARRDIAPNATLRWTQTVRDVEGSRVGQKVTVLEEPVWAIRVRRSYRKGPDGYLTWIVRSCGEILRDHGGGRPIRQVWAVEEHLQQDLLQCLVSAGNGQQLPIEFVTSIDLDSQPDLRR